MLKSFATGMALCLMLAACSHVETATRTGEIEKPLTVMTYNIRIGAGASGPLEAENLQSNMEALADTIKASSPDIVLLQEVDRGTTRVQGMDQVAVMSELTGMYPAWGKTQDFAGGEYGIAILSRYPLSDIEVHQLFKPDYSQSHPDWPAWKSEQRVALVATVDTPWGPFRVIDSHLGITDDQRSKQLEQIASLIDEAGTDMPLVFGGDLNATPEETTLTPIRERLTDAWSVANPERESDLFTFSATEPNRTIDYLFFNSRVAIDSIEIPNVPASDHLPVVAKIRVIE